jgi:hypothetical protein
MPFEFANTPVGGSVAVLLLIFLFGLIPLIGSNIGK